MMGEMRKSFIVIFLVVASESHAWQLGYFSCKNISDIEGCSRNCFPERDKITFEFVVNKEKSMVMRKGFIDGKFKGSLTLQNCRIFDDTNWDCSESKSYSNAELVQTEKMTNGIYAAAIQNLKNGFFVGGCAK